MTVLTLNGDHMLQQDIYVEGDDAISSCAFFEGNGNEYLERQLIFTGHKRGVVNVSHATPERSNTACIADAQPDLEHSDEGWCIRS